MTSPEIDRIKSHEYVEAVVMPLGELPSAHSPVLQFEQSKIIAPEAPAPEEHQRRSESFQKPRRDVGAHALRGARRNLRIVEV
jgi:hypothetical protein